MSIKTLASTCHPPEDPQVNLEIGPAADSGGTSSLVDNTNVNNVIKVSHEAFI